MPKRPARPYALPLGLLAIAAAMAGCAASQKADDPWYGWNRNVHNLNDQIDRYALKPLAQGYHWITPEFVDIGVSNVFSNINDVNVTINDLLQAKFAQGGQDFSRFLLNSTAGVGGMVDIATRVGLPKHNEDFGQTLGAWGIGAGPYLVLPIFGPSSPRDTVGLIGDALLNPLIYVSFISAAASTATASSAAVNITDTRSDRLKTEKIIDEAATSSVDARYQFIKNAHRQRRAFLVNDGHVDELELDVDEGPPPATGDAQPPKQTLKLVAPKENP